MTWILDEAEVLLRADGYSTTRLDSGEILAFENDLILGFLFHFATAAELLQGWTAKQNDLLARFSPALRTSGPKAWSVYAIFLTEDNAETSGNVFALERIEEDFKHTRKIPRASVRTPADVRAALLPILGIANQATLAEEPFADRLARRLEAEIGLDATKAFLSGADEEDVARTLAEKSS